MKLRLCLYAVLLSVLVGCAATAYHTQKLADPVEPINEVVLKLTFGDISRVSFASKKSIDAYKNSYVPAFLKRVPETLQNNGIKVAKVVVGRDYVPVKARYWLNIDGTKFSKQTVNYVEMEFVHYNVTLLDAIENKLVWKAEAIVNIDSAQPLLRSEKLAGDILNSLHKDSLIMLGDGYAKDATGKKITDVFKYSTDK